MKGISYASGAAPDAYRCGKCGAHGVKLWREYQTISPKLLCVACAEQDQGRRLETGPGACDQIGWYVPAVPDEEGAGFWGYTSVPSAGVAWWKGLPMALPLPQAKPAPERTREEANAWYGVDASNGRGVDP
jgi:hypothetical protein